jgi:hypothetical protein
MFKVSPVHNHGHQRIQLADVCRWLWEPFLKEPCFQLWLELRAVRESKALEAEDGGQPTPPLLYLLGFPSPYMATSCFQFFKPKFWSHL